MKPLAIAGFVVMAVLYPATGWCSDFFMSASPLVDHPVGIPPSGRSIHAWNDGVGRWGESVGEQFLKPWGKRQGFSEVLEVKNTSIGLGSKANHFTYLGDAEIGTGSNIGAGTITCNYDGANKFKTIIGDAAFIGSNSSLVAPVTIGNGATVGAGSTITRDVAENSLAVERSKQVAKENYQRPQKMKK